MSIWRNHYFILFFVMSMPFVYMYNIDWPQSLSTVLQLQPYYYSLSKINLIYTFTSVGVTLLIFQLGTIYDKIPLKLSVIAVPTILTVCQLAMMVIFKYYHSWGYGFILAVRILFGLAGESLFMLQAMVFIKIFKQKSGPYIGYGIGVGILGSPTNSLLTPLLYKIFDQVYFPLLIGACLGVVFIIIGIIISIIIIKYDEAQEQEKLLIIQEVKAPPLGLLQQIKTFTPEFWFLQLLIFIQNAVCAGFITQGVDYLHKRFGFLYVNSGQLMLIPYTLGFISSFGWNSLPLNLRNSLVLTSLCTISSFILIYFLPNSQTIHLQTLIISVIFLCLVGITYGGYMMKIVPSIFTTTKPQNSGATYGVVAIAIHSVYLIIPSMGSLIVQSFKDEQEGYRILTFFYFGLGMISLGATLFIRVSKKFEFLDKISNKELILSLSNRSNRHRSGADIKEDIKTDQKFDTSK